MKLFNQNIVTSLILLCLAVAATIWLLTTRSYVLASIMLIVSVVLFFKVVAIYRNTIKKIDFMFNALECDDYTFNFSDSNKSSNEHELNDLLNRTKELLANARTKTIEQEKYYEYIFDRLNTGVLIINERGNILQANRATYNILGVEILAHTNHIAKISESLAQSILSSGDGEIKEVVIATESGEKSFSLMISLVALADKELRIAAISSIDSALDRKEVETWSKLTRVLTHEIMNSLSPITSLSETLIALNENPQMQQGLETIVQTNKSLVSFVENFRSFTAIQKPIKHPFEIKPLLENLLNLICPDNVRYTLEVEPADTMIFGDENQLLQVIVNLLKNGVQAVENSTKREIGVKVYIEEDETVVIEIRNSGAQIKAEVVENLFTPFFTTRKGGKGIGLSVSKRIMQLHGGSLTLTTNQPNNVTFTLLFK